jgi:hypothetical protein
MNPVGPGGRVIAGDADSDGALEVLAAAVAVGSGVGLEVATATRLGLAPPPPRMPDTNSSPTMATTATTPMRTAGPALPDRPLDPVTGGATTASVETGESSVAQFWQNTRSVGLTVPHDGQTIPAGGVGGGSGVGMGCVSAVGPAVPSATGVGVGVGVGVGTGAASCSPVHSRKLPHEPQKLAPGSFSNPHVLQVINDWLPQATLADEGV